MAASHQNIVGLVVHKLEKDRQGGARVVPRTSELTVTEPTQRLVGEIHRLYGDRASKGYGKFEQDEDNYPMPRYARRYFVEQNLNFYDLSILMMNMLCERSRSEPLATGGYVLIAHVENSATHFLLVAMVTNKIGTAITEGLDVVDSTHLDLSALRVAGRIDATAWQCGHERCISFLKGRGEVSDYFKRFLGCNDYIAAPAETQKLNQCLKDFASAKQLSEQETDQFLRQAHDICTRLAEARTAIALDEVANALWPQAPQELQAAFAAPELQLNDGFIPDKRSLRGLIRFKLASPSRAWKLEFERAGLRNGEVFFDAENATLTLRNLPADFIADMRTENNDE